MGMWVTFSWGSPKMNAGFPISALGSVNLKWGQRITDCQVFELKGTALGKLREEECKFKASLGYTLQPCLKNINKKREVYVGRGIGRRGIGEQSGMRDN